MTAARRTDAWVLALALALMTAWGIAARRGPALADEFVYLGGARHFAHTGRLDARYYDASAILRRGHPHQDVHAPGYVLVLGAFMRVLGARPATAVVVNALAYAGTGLLLLRLARALGAGETGARVAAVAFLLLPVSLAYVHWAMAELVLGFLVVAALAVAVSAGDGQKGAIGAALLLGAALVVRESALFAFPAALLVLRGRREVAWFLGTALAAVALVYVPLSLHRAPGGANFWDPVSGTAFSYQTVLAAKAGSWPAVAALLSARVSANLGDLAAATLAEKGILAVMAVVPLLALRGVRARPPRARRLLAGLWLGLAPVMALLFGVYVVAQWSGLRYALFLVVPCLAFLVPPAPRRRDHVLGAAVVAACAVLSLATFTVLDDYKASRQRRQANLTAYVEARGLGAAAACVVLPNGWLYGWRHEGTEVVTSLPEHASELKALEAALWFDYIVLPGDSPWTGQWDQRPRYVRLNPDEKDPPLAIYRRRR